VPRPARKPRSQPQGGFLIQAAFGLHRTGRGLEDGVDITGQRVVIVDDDEALSSVLAYKLRKTGFDVNTISDGMSGIEYLRTNTPDILLLDVMMHKVDGFQVLRSLQQSERRMPPVIVMSARSGEEDVLKAFQLGAIDYVTKPFSLNVLVARMRIALGMKQVGAETADAVR
jgi:two-component system phosphate regulon response regulator PhoB